MSQLPFCTKTKHLEKKILLWYDYKPPMLSTEFLNNFQDSLWSALCGHLTLKPSSSVLLRDSLHLLRLLFQAAVSSICLRPYLAKKQILAILHLISQFWGQHCFSIWSTQNLRHPPRHGHRGVMQRYTHKWMLASGAPRGACAFTAKRQKKATAQTWAYTTYICLKLMAKSQSNGSADPVFHYQQVQN